MTKLQKPQIDTVEYVPTSRVPLQNNLSVKKGKVVYQFNNTLLFDFSFAY